jgi:hypothetical protein
MGDLPDFTQAIAGTAVQQVLSSFVNTSAKVDVSAWASVYVRIGSLSPTDILVMNYTFYDATQSIVLDQGVLACGTVNCNPVWLLPVAGPILLLSVQNGSGSMAAQVLGSNRQSSKRMMYDWTPTRNLSISVANGTASGNHNWYLDLSTDPQIQNSTSYNGPVFLQWNIPAMAGATQWQLRVETINLDGTSVLQVVATATVAGIQLIQFGHPFAFTRWLAINTGITNALMTTSLLVVPGQAA